jgi:hypothetical protein
MLGHVGTSMYRLLLVIAVCTGVAGCAVEQMHHDHDKIRVALLDLYTNQIMDNLIRTSNNMPIIELDYTNAGANLTAHENGVISGSPFAITNTHTQTIAAATTATATKTVLTTIGGGLTADSTNQVQLTANPVTTTPAAYDAYRTFIAIPGSLQTTCDAPPEGAALLCRKGGRTYYWIPIGFKRQLLELSLAAITSRAAAAAPLDPFYSVNILRIVSYEKNAADQSKKDVTAPGKKDTSAKDKDADGDKFVTVTVLLDQKIPNDVGRIYIGSADKAAGYDIEQPFQPQGDLSRPSMTDEVSFVYNQNPTSVFKFEKSLPQAAKVFLMNHRPTQPVVNQDLRMIEFQLQQIQFNQIRNNP